MQNQYLENTFGLKGKAVFITGSARGIGLAIATALGRAGATVVINDLKEDSCAQAVDKLQNEGVVATSEIGRAHV